MFAEKCVGMVDEFTSNVTTRTHSMVMVAPLSALLNLDICALEAVLTEEMCALKCAAMVLIEEAMSVTMGITKMVMGAQVCAKLSEGITACETKMRLKSALRDAVMG